MSRAIEPFGRVPNRLADALATGELTFWGFTILGWLELRTNYRLLEPCWVGTVREMHQATDWPHSEQHLAKELRRLRADLWVSYSVTPGSRRGFEVYLDRAAVFEREQGATRARADTKQASAVPAQLVPVPADEGAKRSPRAAGRRGRAGSVPAPQTQTQNADAEELDSLTSYVNEQRSHVARSRDR